jgi:hypothetical protein
MIPEVLLLVEQIRPRTAQVYNLRTPISIFLQPRALEAVESVRDTFAPAHHALVLIVSERALVADPDESRGSHVGVADGALAVAFVAETADGDAGGLATHDEIAEGVSVHIPRMLGFGGLTGDGATSCSVVMFDICPETARQVVGK